MDNKYIPLYRKYRPQTFHDLIGQENIVHALSNAIKLNRIAHAYLLCGPRGTGKTSSARILAKSLNCKEGPTLTPCGKCPACLDIINSIPVDVIEIDAASNRSVEDTQAILEKIRYVPVNGRYKIYVIDEVHMLSNHAFNALLKTLEEPPENVIFILATTEPHKVLDTIISRCQRFDFRRITTDDIVKRLEYISNQENINISKDALYAIAKNSQGGMRDALALLDQISVLGVNKQIDTNDVNEILGKISYDTLNEITQCIINSDCSKSVSLIDNIYSKGNEPVQIVTNLIQYFRDLMIVKNCSDKELIYSLTQINEVNYDRTKPQADNFTVSEIIQIIDRLSYYAVQIKDTTNKYLWLELCIIDLTNYKNLPSVENLLKRIETLEAQISLGAVPLESDSIEGASKSVPVIEKPDVQISAVKTNNSVQGGNQTQRTYIAGHVQTTVSNQDSAAAVNANENVSANPNGFGLNAGTPAPTSGSVSVGSTDENSVSVSAMAGSIVSSVSVLGANSHGAASISTSDFAYSQRGRQGASIQEQKPQAAALGSAASTNDLHKLWVSILQSIDSPPNRAFYSNLARPVEITQNKVVVAFTKEMFVKQAKEGTKRQALVDAVSKYMNVSNPVIDIITSDSTDLSKKITPPPTPVQKAAEEQNLQKQEEEEYHSFVQAKKEEETKPNVKDINVSGQAAMVKELFEGKYIS